ncbi:hypothetical protein T484DRAFT_2308838, partial [Baffinella frigidus]
PGLGFRFPVSGFRVPGSGFRISGFGFRVPVSGFRVPVSGFRFPVSGFRVPGSGFRVPGFGFRVSGFGTEHATSARVKFRRPSLSQASPPNSADPKPPIPYRRAYMFCMQEGVGQFLKMLTFRGRCHVPQMFLSSGQVLGGCVVCGSRPAGGVVWCVYSC